MSNIIQFNYQSKEVRITKDENGDPLWNAKDVCEILEIDISQTRRLDEDEKGLREIQTPGGPQNMIFVKEPGLYSLIIRSNKPEAKKFKRWITHEVLPQLRKTGFYDVQLTNLKTLTFIQSEANAAVRLAETFGFDGNQALLSANRAMKNKYEVDCLELLGNVHLLADDNEVHLTPTQIGKELGDISPRKINQLLATKGLQRPIRDESKKIRGWEPIGEGVQYSVMKDTGKKHSNGTPVQQLFWKKSILAHLES